MEKENSDVVGINCIFALNQKALDSNTDDLTLIKEVVKTRDGKERRRVRLVENAKRPYWITKKGLQVYRDKRESEPLDNLDKFECNQAALPFELNRKLNYIGGERPRLSHLNRSQYVYGTDVDITTILNHDLNTSYKKEYGDYQPQARRAMLDLETDVVYGHEGILMGTLCFDKDIYLACTESFAKGIDDYAGLFLKFAGETIGDLIEKRGLKLHVKVVKDELAVVKSLFGLAHKLKPDFIAIWNMSFDIPKILKVCDDNNVNPADIFCDPAVPRRYRRFSWVDPTNNVRVKADGKKKNADPTDLWFVVDCLASFQVIDAMRLFRTVRSIEQLRTSYGLDSVLKDYTDISKLKWTGADHINPSSIEWHRFMQKANDSDDHTNRVAYGVYCAFDGISMTILDDVTKDICTALLVYIGFSQVKKIKSNPKRLCDAYHFYLLHEQGRVLCSVSDNMSEEFDKEILGRTDWIITLTNFNVLLKSEGIFKDGYEALEALARIFKYCFDVDITSSYPSNQVAGNMSRDTTLCEVLRIEGITEAEQRRLSVNMTNVPANALDLGQKLFQLPTIKVWEDELEKELHLI